jgi:hypothetical protein
MKTSDKLTKELLLAWINPQNQEVIASVDAALDKYNPIKLSSGVYILMWYQNIVEIDISEVVKSEPYLVLRIPPYSPLHNSPEEIETRIEGLLVERLAPNEE